LTYLTIRQACDALQVSRNTLLAMIADGRVRARNLKKPGGRYDVWRVDVDSVGQELSVLERVKLRKIERRMGL
jgi:excisionase family DNA binding protein